MTTKSPASKVSAKTVDFSFNEVNYTVRKKFTLPALEAMENQLMIEFVKRQVGDDQWKLFVESFDDPPDSDDLDQFVGAMLDAMEVDRGK